LDTALNVSGQRVVAVPFRAWNLTDSQKVDLLVVEGTTTNNQRFDPGERIIFLTPPVYRTQSTHTHAQIATTVPSQALVRPAVGDTNFVLTRRPLTSADRYVISTDRGAVEPEQTTDRLQFALDQNYPNPFNPATTIPFILPTAGRAKVQVYNILGQLVRTLLDEAKPAGYHRLLFDAEGFATGVYFYIVLFENRVIVKKMLLLK
ncbi:MAG: T9SS type A sorting domain-containing protein, partial [Bacteroidota bacterium]